MQRPLTMIKAGGAALRTVALWIAQVPANQRPIAFPDESPIWETARGRVLLSGELRYRGGVRKRVIAIFCCIAFAVVPRAEDWPQWRGARRDGVWRERGILRELPPEGLMVRWRVPVGYGFSSPVIAKGRVYVTDALLDRPMIRGRVLCFEERSGKLLWTFSREKTNCPAWAFIPGQEPGPNATPVVEDGNIYATGPQSHHLYCLEARTGDLIWERDLASDFQIEETASVAASPLVDGNRLIMQVGGKPEACVVAFDKKTGREIWRNLNENAGHGSPIIISAGGKRQLIVWTLQSVSSLDPVTGQLFWREPFVAGNSAAVATPVFSGNRLLVSGLMFKLDEEKPAASVLWPAARGSSRRILSGTSTPLLQGDYAYSLNQEGNLICLEAETGKLIWETDQVTQPKSGTSASMHMTPNRGLVFIYNELGELILAHLGPREYREIGRASLMQPSFAFGGRKVTWVPAAYANRCAYVRNERELVCASLRK